MDEEDDSAAAHQMELEARRREEDAFLLADRKSFEEWLDELNRFLSMNDPRGMQ